MHRCWRKGSRVWVSAWGAWCGCGMRLRAFPLFAGGGSRFVVVVVLCRNNLTWAGAGLERNPNPDLNLRTHSWSRHLPPYTHATRADPRVQPKGTNNGLRRLTKTRA